MVFFSFYNFEEYHMWHHNPETYKKFPGQENIIVGNGELIAVSTAKGKGWITPHNQVIYNREDAVAYASKLNDLIQFNKQRLAKSKVKY